MMRKKKQIEALRREKRLWARRTFVLTDLLRNTVSPFTGMDPQDIVKHVDSILAEVDDFNSRF